MNLRADVLIVGAGIAGACAAFNLSRRHEVLLADRAEAGGGASGAAAGMVNPLPGRRAHPVWRMEEALDALHELLDDIGGNDLFLKSGILRPAVKREQAMRFARAGERFATIASWLDGPAVAADFPEIDAPHGALHVREGGAIAIGRLCRRLVEESDVRSEWNLVDFDEQHGLVRARFNTPDGDAEVEAERMLIAPGAGYRNLPQTANLNLHCVKGQTIRVEVPEALSPNHPHVAGRGYVVAEVPDGDDPAEEPLTRFVLGSTYEHTFSDDRPSSEATRSILEKTRGLMPMLRSASIIEERAGIRVTVPGTRLPMIGPLPGFDRTWIFSGLGTKGLLMAPLISRRLVDWMDAPDTIPHELRPHFRE